MKTPESTRNGCARYAQRAITAVTREIPRSATIPLLRARLEERAGFARMRFAFSMVTSCLSANMAESAIAAYDCDDEPHTAQSGQALATCLTGCALISHSQLNVRESLCQRCRKTWRRRSFESLGKCMIGCARSTSR